MTRKLMTSAFALSAVLAFSALPAASALANPWSGGPDIDDSFNDNSKTDVDVDVDVTDSLNNNSTNDSNNDNSTDLDLDVRDSLNDNSTHNKDSNNDNRDYDDSFNDNSKVEDSNNDNREYKSEVDIDDSFNDNSKVDDSYNSDSSTNDSNNDNSDNSRTNIRVALSIQNLEASVSGFEFDVGGGGHGRRDDDGGSLRTGDISNSGGAFAGFAGIQTATYNTGFAATNQAATAISANANVTFGNGG